MNPFNHYSFGAFVACAGSVGGGKVLNQTKMDGFTKYWVRMSLQRMLDITAGVPVQPPPGERPVRPRTGAGLRILARVRHWWCEQFIGYPPDSMGVVAIMEKFLSG